MPLSYMHAALIKESPKFPNPELYDYRTVKPVLSSHSKRRPNMVIKPDYRLMQVKSIAECSKILQYLRPSLSYHLSLSIFEWPLKTGFTVTVCFCIYELADLIREDKGFFFATVYLWIVVTYWGRAGLLDLICGVSL